MASSTFVTLRGISFLLTILLAVFTQDAFAHGGSRGGGGSGGGGSWGGGRGKGKGHHGPDKPTETSCDATLPTPAAVSKGVASPRSSTA